jgi:hypothetical protein
MKPIYIGSGAVWLLVSMYVWWKQGEVAPVVPIAITLTLLVIASTRPKETARLPTWGELGILVLLSSGAFCYAAGVATFIKWTITVIVLYMAVQAFSSTPEERREAGIKLGSECDT